MSLHVLQSGLHTLLVDRGRPAARGLGVPVGGAADRAALALGNALVGNPPDALALEINLAGPTLRADIPLACVVFGAPFELTSSRQRLRPNRTFTLQPDEELDIGGTAVGVCAYLCVRGGFDGPAALGSRSGLRPVRAGDALPCQPGVTGGRWLAVGAAEAGAPHLDFDARPAPRVVRALAGPQGDWFPGGGFFTGDNGGPTFTVGGASNRMGLRLQGPPLTVPQRELVSEPVCPGTVQVTRDGQCIVLGVDAQTIGGYPKVGQVISADLDLLGQLRPGEAVAFKLVQLEEAEQIYRERERLLRAWCLRIRAAGL